MKRSWIVCSLVVASVLVSWQIRTDCAAKTYKVSLDEYDGTLSAPFTGMKSNTGGVGGALDPQLWSYTVESGSCKAKNVKRSKTGGGFWYTLAGTPEDRINLDFNAIFGPYIRPEYQGRIVAIEILVDRVESPKNNKMLQLTAEFKRFNARDRKPKSLNPKKKFKLLTGDYGSPRVFSFDLTSARLPAVNQVAWSVKNAKPGDSISVNQIRLVTEVPEMPPEEEAFLWSYSWLMSNYDPVTGMVQDRSWDPVGSSENVGATAKAAKATAYAYLKGYVSRQAATEIVTRIADALLLRVVRGPEGKNALWPHLTQNGGSVIKPGSDWSTGDTLFGAMDMIVALELMGDTGTRKAELENFMRLITWQDLEVVGADGKPYLSRGYFGDASKIPTLFSGFGMETLGVNWAMASSLGHSLEMGLPPGDDGSGYNDNASLPMVMYGTDRWENDWDLHRSRMAATQTGWYCTDGHINTYLCTAGLFGLSAAETPEGDSYRSFGVGREVEGFYEVLPDDGNSEVVVLHYAAMIADLEPAKATDMWVMLRDRQGLGSFLGDRVIISPLNSMESLRVNKVTGLPTVNHLRGSWNLALQTEGWALADPLIRTQLTNAITANEFLRDGFTYLTTLPLP